MSSAKDEGGGAKLTRKEIRARERARLEAEAGAARGGSPVPEAAPQAWAQEPWQQENLQDGEPLSPAQDPDREPGYFVPEQPQHEPESSRVFAQHGSHDGYYTHEDVSDRSVHPDGGHYVGGDRHDASWHQADQPEEYHLQEDHLQEDRHDADRYPAAAGAVRGPSRKVRHRRRWLAVLLTLALFVAVITAGVQFLRPLLGVGGVSDYPGPGSGEVQVSVEAGEGTRSFAAKLEAAGVIADAGSFEAAFAGSGETLSPGEYSFRQEMNNAGAIEVLTGEGGAGVVYFALNAGLRINESLMQIAEGAHLNFAELEALSNSPAQFGLPANARNLEGFLAPGEYRFDVGSSARDILQKLVDVTVDELVDQGITDPAKQYEAVIVASIVQAEGGLADYPNVAGAIYNRLKPNDQTYGYLQVDSAVTYGLGTKSFNFTDEERADKSNPYNTYANPGLPPGPIGSPGKAAIDAAANPAPNDYLYWVTINLDTAETKFSATLAEHNRYVEQYNSWCMANPGRCT